MSNPLMIRKKTGFFMSAMIMLTFLLGVGAAQAIAPEKPAESDVRKVIIAVRNDMVPFQFKEASGQPAGILVDLWKLWSTKVKADIAFISGSRAETIAMVRDGRADLHAGLTISDADSEIMNFGQPLATVNSHLFYHYDLVGIETPEDLRPYRIGVLKAAGMSANLHAKLPRSALIQYTDRKSLYEAVLQGDVKVFADVEQTAQFFLYKKNIFQVFNYDVEDPIEKKTLFPAVRSENRKIAAWVEQGWQKISAPERTQIARRWIVPHDAELDQTLIVACDRNNPPFTQLGADGKAYGMLIDLWRLWAEKTEQRVEFLMTDWPNTLTAVEDGQADFHSGLPHTAERSLWMHFSKQIYEVESALFYLPVHGAIASAEALSGQTVGTIRESYQADFLGKNFPELGVVEFDSYSGLIEAAERGLIKSFMDEVQRVKYRMFHRYQRGQYQPLASPRVRNQIHAGALLENAELIATINAGLSRITLEEWRELEERWIIDAADRIYSPRKRKIELDPKEIAWLAAHPDIRIGVDPDYPPYSFVNDSGQYAGVSADYVQILNDSLGINMRFVSGPTGDDILDGVRQGRIDVAATVHKSTESEAFLSFSQTYIPTPQVIITRNDNSRIKSRYDIEGEKIALVRGYASHEQIAREFPGIETFWYAKPLYALRAVSTGRADAYIGAQGTCSYLISSYAMANLKVAAIYDDSREGQRFGVRKDWPELTGILDKALNTIPPGDRFKIMSKWITLGLDLTQQKRVVLTKEEKIWLAGKKNMRLGVDPAWPPFEFFDASRAYAGIASDYVKVLNKRLNINMAPVSGLSWPEVLTKTRKGEIDVLPCVAKTPERSKYLLFTRPYLSFPMVILTREDAPYISSVMDLKSEKVAIVKGYATQEIMERNYPDREFFLAKNVDEALRAVSRGSVEAFVGNLASISYATQKLELTNLKVVTTTPYKYELAFAVRKDWPELVTILNKMLETIAEADSATIHNRWINVRFERQFDWMLVLKIIIPIVLVGGLALFIFVRWNRALSREVSERKKLQEALLESRATARGLLDATRESLLLLDKEGTVLAVNQTAAHRLNREPEDLVGTNRFDLLPEDVRQRRQKMLDQVLQTGTPADFEDTRDGIIFRSRYYPVKDNADEIVGVAIFSQDITERKKAEQAVKASEERLKTILETTHEGFWMIDDQTRTLDINNAMCRLLRVRRDQVIGKKVVEFLDEENRSIHATQMQLREQGIGSVYELSFVRSDGGLVPCILSATPLLDADGNKIGAFAMVTDITERKQTEEELHRNLEDLERFSKMAIGREERMIELKNEINDLRQAAGLEGKYKIVV